MKIFSKFTLPQFEYDSSDYLPENIVPNHLNRISQNSHFWGNLKFVQDSSCILFIAISNSK